MFYDPDKVPGIGFAVKHHPDHLTEDTGGSRNVRGQFALELIPQVCPAHVAVRSYPTLIWIH